MFYLEASRRRGERGDSGVREAACRAAAPLEHKLLPERRGWRPLSQCFYQQCSGEPIFMATVQPRTRANSSSRPLLVTRSASRSSSSGSDDEDDRPERAREVRYSGAHGKFYGWQRKLLGLGSGVLVGTEEGTMRGEKILDDHASDVDGFYVGWRITTENPPAKGVVQKYAGATKTVTVALTTDESTSDATSYTITNNSPSRELTRCVLRDFGEKDQQMAALTFGSVAMLLAQLAWALALTRYCVSTVHCMRYGSCAVGSGADLSASGDDADDADEWLTVRFISFLSFVWLSVAQRLLLLSVTRFPARGRTVGNGKLFQDSDYREEIESEARELCLWLWLPIALGFLTWVCTTADASRAGWIIVQNLFPVCNVGATGLLLGSLFSLPPSLPPFLPLSLAPFLLSACLRACLPD